MSYKLNIALVLFTDDPDIVESNLRALCVELDCAAPPNKFTITKTEVASPFAVGVTVVLKGNLHGLNRGQTGEVVWSSPTHFTATFDNVPISVTHRVGHNHMAVMP